ncbi:MAG TPA: hypothetical protein VGI56_04975 [Galbitalea sp.]|jgi:hypothetical protein
MASQRILVIGKSPVVLSEAERLLNSLGFAAASTDRFEEVTGDFDLSTLDLVVFGGRVPDHTKVKLKSAITAAQPQAIFVDGLSGIPGLIVAQVRGALLPLTSARLEQTHTAHRRSLVLELASAAAVTVTVWWQTSAIPPNPGSDSRILVERRLTAGVHEVRIPDDIANEVAFASVEVNESVRAFALAQQI